MCVCVCVCVCVLMSVCVCVAKPVAVELRCHATALISDVRLIFISLMNTKTGIFSRGFTTHENTAFGVYSMK